MNTTQLSRVRRLFFRPDIPMHVSRHNAIAWVRSVRYLGDKWLLHTPIKLKEST